MKNNLWQGIRSVLTVTEKNIRIYYSKPPIMIFGLILPFFLFLAFYLGRDVDIFEFFPGFIAMAVFFTSSSVGPLVTPWEKSMGTYERLLCFPVTVNTILLGDVLAGMLFGLGLSAVIIMPGLILIGYSANIVLIVVGVLVASFCFSSLGVLLASPSTKSPSNIMMLSSIVRFPLIFISGIFVPLDQLPFAGRILSYFSPITYMVDILNHSLRDAAIMHPAVSFLALAFFCFLFLFSASRLHKRNLLKGL